MLPLTLDEQKDSRITRLEVLPSASFFNRKQKTAEVIGNSLGDTGWGPHWNSLAPKLGCLLLLFTNLF